MYSIAGRISRPGNDTVEESHTTAPKGKPRPITPESNPLFEAQDGPIEDGKANAAILMLARNRELEGAKSSMRQLEETFNHKYQYPWIFLNEEPFTDQFKE